MKHEISTNVPSAPETREADTLRELDVAEIAEVGGAYACGYSGTHDYTLMMSYENRLYSC